MGAERGLWPGGSVDEQWEQKAQCRVGDLRLVLTI